MVTRWWSASLTAAGLLALLAVPAQAEEAIDRELGKYWNVEQAVPSLQNPMHERKGAFEASVHAGVVPNDSYYLPLPVGARLTYFITDTLALEAGGSYLLGGTKDLQDKLECITAGSGTCISLVKNARKPPKMKLLSSLDLNWVPFHGKLGVFTQKISSFDLGFSAGVGFLQADIDYWQRESAGTGGGGLNNRSWTYGEGGSAVASDVIKTEFRVAGHWGAGFRFYLTRNVALRVDYKQFAYKPNSDQPWTFPVEGTVGAAFLLK